MTQAWTAAEQTLWRGVRVMVVDDVEAMRTLTTALLQQLGLTQVVQAQDGHDALEKLARHPVDLVLSDWRMPGLDGLGLLRALREAGNGLPFILVTADHDPGLSEQARDEGAQAVLVKPYLPPQLVQALREALPDGGAARQLQQLVDTDLGSPLAAALGLLDPLLQDEGLDAERRQALQGVEQALLEAIERWQLSSVRVQIEQGRFQLRTRGVPLRRVMERAARLVAESQAHRGLRVQLELPGPLRGEGCRMASGDPLLCHGLFTLLLQEVARRAPNGGTLAVRLLPDGDGAFCLELGAGLEWGSPMPGWRPASLLAMAQRGRLQCTPQGLRLRLLRASQIAAAGA